MTGPGDRPSVPDLSAGLSREEAIALRESFDPEEQERISHTVAALLDLLGKAHTMAVLSAFAFAGDRFDSAMSKPNSTSRRTRSRRDYRI